MTEGDHELTLEETRLLRRFVSLMVINTWATVAGASVGVAALTIALIALTQ